MESKKKKKGKKRKMDSKILHFGQEARDKMVSGVQQLARAVKSTLGPRGRNVIIQRMHTEPHVTKDGVTVAQEIVLPDPFENMGAQVLKQAASQTADIAGDGTTTATVLAEAILVEGMKRVVANQDPMSLKRGIDKATLALVEQVREQSREVANTKEIKQVATISANGDTEIGDIIAEAMDQVGKDGVVTLEEGKGKRESSLRVTSGFEFDRGYLHPAFCNDVERQRVVLENPAVWIINGQISTGTHMQDMMPVLEYCNKNGVPLLVVAENVEGEVLATLVVNKLRGTLNVVAVKAPGFGSTRQDLLGDLASLTGASLRDPAAGDDLLNEISGDELGQAKQVVVTKETTVVVGDEGREQAIETRVAQIRALLEDQSLSAWDRERVEKRLAKLVGGVAVIEVGAATEVEMKEKKDRFEDALAATKAAVQEGIIPGGGVALVRAADSMKDFSTGNPEEDEGVKLVLRAATAPLQLIVENAGNTGEVILSRVRESDSPTVGYNAASQKIEDMFEAGIVDPTKVTRIALENAASVAGTMLTTECAIGMEPKEDPVMPAPMHM